MVIFDVDWEEVEADMWVYKKHYKGQVLGPRFWLGGAFYI